MKYMISHRFQCKNLFSSLDHPSIHPIFAPEMGLEFGTKASHSQTGAFYADCFFLDFFLLGIVVGDVFTFYHCRSCCDHILQTSILGFHCGSQMIFQSDTWFLGLFDQRDFSGSNGASVNVGFSVMFRHPLWTRKICEDTNQGRPNPISKISPSAPL